MKYLILILTLILTSCVGPDEKNKLNQIASQNSLQDNLKAAQKSSLLDTLNDPYHRSYLVDRNTKEIGQMFLDNKLLPNDNVPTLRTIDSLFCKNPEDRKFYFRVFVKIMDKADGALAEEIGLKARLFIQKYTYEFLDLSANLTEKQFSTWATFVGWEIQLSSIDDPVKEGESFIEKLNTISSELDNERKQRLEDFNKIISMYLKEKNK
jgi:hypothetical protein